MLYHRSGTEYEDMYWIDADTCRIVGGVTNSKRKRHIEYPRRIKRMLRKQQSQALIVLHTHPNSGPPSIDDFNSCYSHRYRLGIIICHNGGIYMYSSGVIVSRQLYRLYCSEFIDRGLSECEARIQAIKEIERNNEIVFEEVK